MSAHSPQAGETLQGAGGPNWCSWPAGSSGTDWRDWAARVAWTLRAAGNAWITWKPGIAWGARADRPDRPDRTDGRVNDGTSDASVDDELGPSAEHRGSGNR